jgi:hypothetical protein
MRIGVGLVGRSYGWEELLSQEGVPWRQEGPDEFSEDPWSVVALCAPPDAEQWRHVVECLRRGSALLASAGALKEVDQGAVVGEPSRIRYLVPDPREKLAGVGLIDVEGEGDFPREANCLKTNDGVFALSVGEYRGSPAVVLPFDPGTAYRDFRALERYFPATSERLPSERVARVSKGEVLHLLHAALEHLHHVRDLPYVRLSPFPPGNRSVFMLRIDTDGGTRSEIDQLEKIAGEFSFGMSWFLDVQSHASWLSRFAAMERHEIGLHCFEHRVYLDLQKDRANVRHGRSVLSDAGIPVSSFASPFGFWSHDFARILEEEGFVYSSEFSWAYDTYPCYPVSESRRFATLQIPVHPVSIGSLRKSGYSPKLMTEYYDGVIERKFLRKEPLAFYQHPGHRTWDVVRALCRSALRPGVRPMTLGEYADWWRRRLRMAVEIRTDGTTLSVRHPSGGDENSCSLLISTSEGEAEGSLAPTIVLKEQSWRLRPSFVPPGDIRRIREFDLRGEIGRQFTRFQRRFL